MEQRKQAVLKKCGKLKTVVAKTIQHASKSNKQGIAGQHVEDRTRINIYWKDPKRVDLCVEKGNQCLEVHISLHCAERDTSL